MNDANQGGAARGWSPRYSAYCRATGGLTPAETVERDRSAYPGGHMAGFLVWSSQRLREWRAETKHGGHMTTADHAAYDAWLDAQPAPDAETAAWIVEAVETAVQAAA